MWKNCRGERGFSKRVKAVVTMEEVPIELILNWDQTGIKIVPSSSWTMDKKGIKRVEVAGASDKILITAVFCGSATGDFLPVQVIYRGGAGSCVVVRLHARVHV